MDTRPLETFLTLKAWAAALQVPDEDLLGLIAFLAATGYIKPIIDHMYPQSIVLFSFPDTPLEQVKFVTEFQNLEDPFEFLDYL